MPYCNWSRANDLPQNYHDNEWGVPVHDDRGQFEHLMMEAMQCGLSWNLMLRKREIFRACFDGFDFEKIAQYTEDDIDRILHIEGMIRSEPKVRAVIHNAKRFLEIRREFGTFSDYLWAFSDGRTILYNRHDEGCIPVSNGLSGAISRDLKKRGFKYLGSVTLYSHLQACGIINDHSRECPCYDKINSAYPTVKKRRNLEVGAKKYD